MNKPAISDPVACKHDTLEIGSKLLIFKDSCLIYMYLNENKTINKGDGKESSKLQLSFMSIE